MVTASIGIALSTDNLDNPEALLRDADMAMYRAKANGRARRELFQERHRDEGTTGAALIEELGPRARERASCACTTSRSSRLNGPLRGRRGPAALASPAAGHRPPGGLPLRRPRRAA